MRRESQGFFTKLGNRILWSTAPILTARPVCHLLFIDGASTLRQEISTMHNQVRLQLLGKRVLHELRMLIPLILLMLSCLIPKISRGERTQRYEFFPFSHFPMYSDFDERDYYVYVTDGNDQPIATETVAAVRSTKLKKIFDTELDSIQKKYKKRKDQLSAEQCRPGGDYTVKWLYENASDAAREVFSTGMPLRLYRIYITEEKGELVETPPQLVGEWSPGRKETAQ